MWIGIPSPFDREGHNIARRFGPVTRHRIHFKVVNGCEGSVDVVQGPFPLQQGKGLGVRVQGKAITQSFF